MCRNFVAISCQRYKYTALRLAQNQNLSSKSSDLPSHVIAKSHDMAIKSELRNFGTQFSNAYLTPPKKISLKLSATLLTFSILLHALRFSQFRQMPR